MNIRRNTNRMAIAAAVSAALALGQNAVAGENIQVIADEAGYRVDTFDISSITMEGGVMIPEQGSMPIGQTDGENGILYEIASAVLDFMMPKAHALDLTALSLEPRIIFDDTDDLVTEAFAIDVNPDVTPFWGILDGYQNHYWFQYTGSADAGLADTENSIVINAAGDISLADSAFVFERLASRLGIGTSAPFVNFQINDVIPEIRLVDESDSGTMDIQYDLDFLKFEGNTGQAVLSLSEAAPMGSVFVAANGDVGIGTKLPDSRLHLRANTGSTKAHIEEFSGTVLKRYLLTLENNGATGFELDDNSTGDRWQFSTTATGHFTASSIGTGGSEFMIRKTGEFIVGPGGTSKLRVDPAGNGFFAGQVVANGVTLTSDRNLKQNFREIDPSEILAKVNEMDITRWNFKAQNPEVDHIGPMAQDFYEAFGTGQDDKHISPMDMASVALAAVKGLQQELSVRDAEIAALRSQLVEQNEQIVGLSDQQRRLDQLEASLKTLLDVMPQTGSIPVALKQGSVTAY